MSRFNTDRSTATTRRRFLAASGTAAAAAVAGCSALADAIANQVLEDVNVFNQLNRRVGGSVTVVAPSSETALEESFELPSVETDGESNFVAYDDVWGEPGNYEVSAEFSSPENEATSEAERTVAIKDTDEYMLGVAIGADVVDELIAIRAGRSLSDFGWEARSNQTARSSTRELVLP